MKQEDKELRLAKERYYKERFWWAATPKKTLKKKLHKRGEAPKSFLRDV